MKKSLLLPITFFVALSTATSTTEVSPMTIEAPAGEAPLTIEAGFARACEFEGIPLYGKVQFVDVFADIQIEYVNAFPDIKVRFVNGFPKKCGEWQVVDAFPDFTVQVVNGAADLKVQRVNAFPGME